MKKLPIGLQNLREMRTQGYVYVDMSGDSINCPPSSLSGLIFLKCFWAYFWRFL